MTQARLLAVALMGLFLSGCKPDEPPKSPGEQALANLTEFLRNERGSTRLVPLYCDNGASGASTIPCHANLINSYAGEDKKSGSSTFSCEVKPEGTCVFASATDRDGTPSPPTVGAPACGEPLRLALAIDLADGGQAVVSDYTTGGTTQERWTSASVTLQDHSVRLTEEQVRKSLDGLAERVAHGCGEAAVKKIRIFLYPSGVQAGESANWIARLDDNGQRHVEINQAMLKDERVDPYACLHEKAPGKDLGLGTKLPPERQRQIIGTWAGMDEKITTSLERAHGKVYRVYRSAHCGSGDRGEPLQTRAKGRYAVIDSRNGDYFEVLPSGDLGIFDRDGRIDVMPKHAGLYPAPPRQ